MRVIAFVALIALLSPVDGVSQTPNPPNPEPTGLLMGYVVEGYFGEVYTAPPRQEYAFFQGEPIAFKIGIKNFGPVETTLVIAGTDPQQLFRIESVKAPPLPPDFTGERPLTANRRRFQDEQEI